MARAWAHYELLVAMNSPRRLPFAIQRAQTSDHCNAPPRPNGPRDLLRPGGEVLIDNQGEFLPVRRPMLPLRVILQARDPIGVEFVDDGIDAVPLQPPVA